VFDDAGKETPWSGVYCLKDGKLTLVTKELSGPNGIAFSPDEKYLYVDNWDPKRKVIMRYEVSPDGSISNGRVFYDITRTVPGDDAWDGLKVDQRGNLYAAGPAGIYVANFNWGDEDRRSLYITASTGLYRIRLKVPGAGAWTDLAAASQ
jgi:gluconolactonase